MFYELIATIAAGFVGGGLALATRRIVGILPRWLVPVSAGGAMFAVAITLEYSWFTRTKDTLPDGVDVALTRESQAPWRPWTYAFPFVDRFIAVDAASARTHPAAPERRMMDLIVFTRWNPPSRVRAVFDCERGRRADIVEGVTLSEDGQLDGATWHETGLEHPVTGLACGSA